MCKVLEVSRSGFYAWRKRCESDRSKRHRELVSEMKVIHSDRDMRSYGSPRMHRELVARGKRCSENTVARLMRDHRMRAAFQQLLRDENITCSMSRKGNCWDNAMMESFFATLKKERIHLEEYATRAEARTSVFDYIERFYNRLRRHSALGYVSPDDFEQAA